MLDGLEPDVVSLHAVPLLFKLPLVKIQPGQLHLATGKGWRGAYKLGYVDLIS